MNLFNKIPVNKISSNFKNYGEKIIPFLLLATIITAVHRYIILRDGDAFIYTIKWDLPQFIWPKLSFLTDSLQNNIWPLWNPYDFAGAPLFSNLQTLYYHPLILLYAFLIGFSLETLQTYLLILYIWGSINIYLLSTHFNVPLRISIVFGTLYTVSGFALGNAEHFPQLHLFLTEPLTLYLCLRFIKKPGYLNLCLAIFGFTTLISCGYPSILGHLIVFNLFFISHEIIQNKEDLIRKFSGILFISIVSLIIMGPFLLPAFFSIPYITRGDGVSFDTFISHSLSFPYLISILNPFLGQMLYPNTADDVALKNCGIGFLTLFLVSFSIFRHSGRKFLLFYLAISLLGSLGGNVPFMANLLYKIPFLNNSRHVTMEFRVLLVFISFLIAIISFNDFINEKNRKIIFLSIFTPLIFYLTAIFSIFENMDIWVIHVSLHNYLRILLPLTICKFIVIGAPILFLLAYYTIARSGSRFLKWGIVFLGLLEGLLIAPANYFTVLDPDIPRAWPSYQLFEQQRVKDFPAPTMFQRRKIYPQLSSIGSISKDHTDWGMDGTVLKSITNLLNSKESYLLYGPYIWFSDNNKIDIPQYAITGYSPNRVEVTIDPIMTPKIIVFNFMHYPGWKAFAQGQERECYSTMNGFICANLIPGDSKLELRFQPTYFYVLLSVSSLIIISLLLFPLLRKMREPGQ